MTKYSYHVAIPFLQKRTWANATKPEYDKAVNEQGHTSQDISPRTLAHYDKDGGIVAYRRKI